jgi:hypothetical protein
MFKSWIAVLIILGAVTPGLAMLSGWNIRESPHFIVYYRGVDSGFADEAIKKAEGYYLSLPLNLGVDPQGDWGNDKRVKIYIYDDIRQFRAATREPLWSDGSSIQRLRVIFSHRQAKNFLDQALPHELAHIIFRETVGHENRVVPVWLEEGVASSQENRDFSFDLKQLKALLDNGGLMSTAGLQRFDLRGSVDKEKIDIFYLQSGAIVRYLLSSFGPKIFGDFCRSLAWGKDLEKSLRGAFGFKDIRELDLAWRRSLQG